MDGKATRAGAGGTARSNDHRTGSAASAVSSQGMAKESEPMLSIAAQPPAACRSAIAMNRLSKAGSGGASVRWMAKDHPACWAKVASDVNDKSKGSMRSRISAQLTRVLAVGSVLAFACARRWSTTRGQYTAAARSRPTTTSSSS